MNTYDIIVNNEIVETLEQQGRSNGAMSYIIMDRVYQLTSNYKALVEVLIVPQDAYIMFKRGVFRGHKFLLQDLDGEWIELKKATKYYEEDKLYSRNELVKN